MSTERTEPWSEYARACVWVDIDGRWLRFAPEPAASGSELWPFDPDAAVHVITAYNPSSSTTDKAINEERQRALEDELRGHKDLELLVADGADRERTHVEPSVAMVGLTRRDAARVGLRYEQNAVFEITRDELRIVRCDTSDVVSRSRYSLTPCRVPRL